MIKPEQSNEEKKSKMCALLRVRVFYYVWDMYLKSILFLPLFIYTYATIFKNQSFTKKVLPGESLSTKKEDTIQNTVGRTNRTHC